MNVFQKRERRTKIIFSIIGIVVGAIFLFPLYWMIVTSLKTQVDIFKVPTSLYPKTLYIDSYLKQFSGEYNDTIRGFCNSVIISLSTMVIATTLSIPAAYGIARFKFKGKKIVIMLFLLTQMLPSTLVLTPLYIMFNKMGIINNYLAPIIADATIGIPFSILILRTYFISIPKELDEAAKVDGCNHLTAFIRIMLPIAKPGVVVAAVFSLLFAWGDLIYGLTFMTKPIMRPITSGIYDYIQQYQTLWNFTMAFGFIAIIPVIVIFIFMQKYIVSGLTNGAVKA